MGLRKCHWNKNFRILKRTERILLKCISNCNRGGKAELSAMFDYKPAFLEQPWPSATDRVEASP